jgi:short-subunit dehydrogenase
MLHAIFGAGGAVGKALATELAAHGQPFRVVGRSEECLRREFQRYEGLVEYSAFPIFHSTCIRS